MVAPNHPFLTSWKSFRDNQMSHIILADVYGPGLGLREAIICRSVDRPSWPRGKSTVRSGVHFLHVDGDEGVLESPVIAS